MYFSKPYNLRFLLIRSFCLVGGGNKTDQWKQLKAGVEVIIASPGRLIELIRKGAVSLTSRCSFVVIDEADVMFSMGF